jgi:GLPGLI family protein
MKHYLIISFLIFSNYMFSQNYSGKITYAVETFEVSNDFISLDPEQSEFRKNMQRVAKQLSFELLFDQGKAVFAMSKFLPLDKDGRYVKTTISLLGGYKTYYTNTEHNKLLEEKSFLGKDFLVETPFNELKWELLNESKIIDGYTCYKAVRNRIATGRDFTKTKVAVYAWYCPDIPLNSGPFEAVGLPGLVLEFRTPGYSYVANTIVFNQKVILKEIPKGKTISKDAFDEIVHNRAKKGLSLD